MPNVLISSKIGSEWRFILGHPQLIECMGSCVLSLAHGSVIGVPTYCEKKKKKSRIFSLNSVSVRALGWSLLGIFLGFCFLFFEGDLWGKS